MQHHIVQLSYGEMSNSALLRNVTWKQWNIKWLKIKIVELNIVQHLHSPTLDSATVNSAASKSAT